ncbi:AAA family ATPase [Nonomuraea sp. NPDC002799]
MMEHARGLLTEALADARQGRGRAVFVLGEPGSGRSRLAQAALAEAAAEGMITLRGRASELGGPSRFRPLHEALLVFSRDTTTLPDELGPYRSVLGRLIPDWRAEDRGDDGSLIELAEGVVRLLSLASRARGALLVLEDLCDEDIDTLVVAEYLADTIAAQPTFMLCTLCSCADRAVRIVERTRRLGHVRCLNLSGPTGGPARLQQATADWLREGDAAPLRPAREAAVKAGAESSIHDIDTMLALDATLRGEFDRASGLWPREAAGQTRAVRAVHAAHRGRRREMEELLGSVEGPEPALAVGLGRAFCALLEDDVPAARSVLATIGETVEPLAVLSGKYGLALLLDALQDGQDEGLDEGGANVRWNRHFAALARAVRLGRAGRPDEAALAMAEAAEAGGPYPVARHLGLRLVAPEAHVAGWGEPAHWLRQAEDFFFQTGVPVLARRCRELQRRIGLPIRQRRLGSGRVPQRLRNAGVTAREYEVLELLARACGNRDIAARLHLSPRTVERHVGNLLDKTGLANRTELGEYFLLSSRGL